MALEKADVETQVEIAPEQTAFPETPGPCFRERHLRSAAPGEVTCADTFFAGNLKGIAKV